MYMEHNTLKRENVIRKVKKRLNNYKITRSHDNSAIATFGLTLLACCESLVTTQHVLTTCHVIDAWTGQDLINRKLVSKHTPT